MDIKIENDIKLRLSILSVEDSQAINIQAIKCTLRNTCMHHKHDYTNHYCAHNSNCIEYYGASVYNVLPSNVVDKCGNHTPHNHRCDYIAYTHVEKNTNIVNVYFPAKDQKELGSYDLCIQLFLYEEGWGKDNIHTYTIVERDVFNLVEADDNNGNAQFDGIINLDIRIPSSVNMDIKDVETVYYGNDSDELSVTELPATAKFTTDPKFSMCGDGVHKTLYAFVPSKYKVTIKEASINSEWDKTEGIIINNVIYTAYYSHAITPWTENDVINIKVKD